MCQSFSAAWIVSSRRYSSMGVLRSFVRTFVRFLLFHHAVRPPPVHPLAQAPSSDHATASSKRFRASSAPCDVVPWRIIRSIHLTPIVAYSPRWCSCQMNAEFTSGRWLAACMSNAANAQLKFGGDPGLIRKLGIPAIAYALTWHVCPIAYGRKGACLFLDALHRVVGMSLNRSASQCSGKMGRTGRSEAVSCFHTADTTDPRLGVRSHRGPSAVPGHSARSSSDLHSSHTCLRTEKRPERSFVIESTVAAITAARVLRIRGGGEGLGT